MYATRIIAGFCLLLTMSACQVIPPADDFVPPYSLDPSYTDPLPLNVIPCVDRTSGALFRIELDEPVVMSQQRRLSGRVHVPIVRLEDLPDEQRAAFDANHEQPIREVFIELVDAGSCNTVTRVPVPLDEFPKPFDLGPDALRDLAEGNYVARVSSGDERFGVSAQRFILQEKPSPCADPDAGRAILEVSARKPGLTIEKFRASDGTILCFDVASEEGVDTLVINGQQVLADDSRLAETITYPGVAGINTIAIDAVTSARIRVRELPGSVATAQKLRERWLCRGRLAGFIDHGINTTRRAIPREGVSVACTVTFEISRIQGSGSIEVQTIKLSNAVETDENGHFEILFDFDSSPIWGIPEDAELVSFVASCALRDCGIDALPASVTPAPVPDGYSGIDASFYATINNVVDVAVDGLVARLVTTDPNPYRPSRAPGEVVATSADSSFSNPNDYPVIYHEAFDPLREDGTRYLYWLLSGQYVDKHNRNGDKIFDSPCEGIIRGPCIPCTRLLENCDRPDVNACMASANAGESGFEKIGLDVMSPMVNSGYDVWLVDSILDDGTVFEIARRSPAMYQAILDFPQRDRFDVSLPVVGPGLIPERRLAIGGVSTGAVVSKVALRLWELRDAIEQDPAAYALYRLHQPASVVDGLDRVAFYFSIEAPHKGALLPPTLQAFITDKDFKATTADTKRIKALLESEAIRELVADYVEPGKNTPCWDGDGLSNCTYDIEDVVPPGNAGPDGDPATQDSRFEVMQRRMTTELDSYDPANSVAMSGMPFSIPRVAITNGSLTQPALVDNDRLARVKADGWILAVAVIIPFPYHVVRTARLNDSVSQPMGSGLPQVCDLKRGEGSQSVNDFDWISTAGSVDVNIDIFMHPGSDGDNVFPTFVKTSSALAVPDLSSDSRRQVDTLWDDAMAPTLNLPHFAVTEQQCRFVMYHLDGWMRGDRDGYPACGGSQTSCADGARAPGFVLNPFSANDSAYCDPDDTDASAIPWIIRFGEILQDYETGDALLVEPN